MLELNSLQPTLIADQITKKALNLIPADLLLWVCAVSKSPAFQSVQLVREVLETVGKTMPDLLPKLLQERLDVV